MTDASLVAELKATFLFEQFTDEQVSWVADHADVVRLDAGSRLFTEETEPDAFWVLLDGEMEFSRLVDGREVVLVRESQPGSWGGWLPTFETISVRMRARLVRDSRLLRLSKDAMRYVMAEGFPLTDHLISGVMSGARTFEGVVLQQEKLAALGRLSAGLAHELNNPAAAAGRAASDLRVAIRTRDERALGMIGILDVEQVRQNLLLVQEVGRRDPVRLDTIARGEREDEVAGWLGKHGVENGYELGASLVDASVTIEDLEQLRARIPAQGFPDTVSWLEAATTADELSRLIETSVGRISALVAAIKAYTFMDRGDGQQEVDLHQGLDNTLLILHHELKSGIEVVRAYDETLPKVCAYGSELNQVWTNLIENAVQAMDGKGRLRVSTGLDGDCALVEIGDDGPGIPDAVKDRIFEPFFTTKGVGVGTGMGLDIVRRIVWKHGGDIRVESRPGDTRFLVRLPLPSS
jgi:signal transduction histidine kinase